MLSNIVGLPRSVIRINDLIRLGIRYAPILLSELISIKYTARFPAERVRAVP